eukprot:s2633_g6.t1
MQHPDKPRIDVQCKGLSAISFVQVLQRKMREKLEQFKEAEAFLARVVKSFAVACFPRPTRPRVSIDEGIAELWEKSLAAKDSHDLTVVTADGVATAHAHMLKAASSVVTAMLESPMKEGKAHRIEIKDTPSKAVSLFLETLGGTTLRMSGLLSGKWALLLSCETRSLYTCSAKEEPDHEIALGALDLAHRWQVEVVLAILTDLLAGMIKDESFQAIGEHAVLKGLERLKTAAQRFGAESEKVQADLKAGRLPATVAQLFHGSPSRPEPKPKRLRM